MGSNSETNSSSIGQGTGSMAGQNVNQDPQFVPDVTHDTSPISVIDHSVAGKGAVTEEAKVDIDKNTAVNITTFSDQSNVNTAEIDVALDRRDKIGFYTDLTLQQFLERPFPIATVDWTSGSPQGAVILSTAVVDQLLSRNNMECKLRNYAYFKFSLRLEFRVNATQFHYGRLVAAWYPYFQDMRFGSNYTNLRSALGFPNVQIETTSSTTSVLQVPFIAPWNFMPKDPASFVERYGSLIVFVLNPLTAVDTPVASVDVTVWASFQNVELAGPYAEPPPQLVLQMNREQVDKSRSNMVTSLIRKVPVMDSILEAVPGLSELAPLAGMFMDDPNSLETTSAFAQKFPKNANSTGLNFTDTLGLKPDNSVGPCVELMGCNKDQMGILDIMQTPMLLDTFEMDSSQASGTILYSYNLTPPFKEQTFLNHVLRCVQYCRGSLRICVQAVASCFHSARVRIALQPWNDQIVLYSTDETSNVVNTVLDLKEQTEMYFTVPYLATLPWLSTELTGSSFNNTLGVLIFQVSNALTSSRTPIMPIYFNVYISAGSDFQIAAPRVGQLMTLAPVLEEKEKERSHLHLQSLSQEEMKTAAYPPLIAGVGYRDKNVCMGERLTHLKEFLCRYQYLGEVSSVSAGFDPLATTVGPFPDYIQHFGYIFRFMRGSFNYRLVKRTNDLTVVSLGYSATLQTTKYGLSSVDLKDNLAQAANGNAVSLSKNQIISVTVPYYANANFVFTDHPISSTFTYRAYLVVSSQDVTPFDALSSVGDDFHFGYRIGVPAENPDPTIHAGVISMLEREKRDLKEKKVEFLRHQLQAALRLQE